MILISSLVAVVVAGYLWALRCQQKQREQRAILFGTEWVAREELLRVGRVPDLPPPYDQYDVTLERSLLAMAWREYLDGLPETREPAA